LSAVGSVPKVGPRFSEQEVVRWTCSFRSCCSFCSSRCRASCSVPRPVVHTYNGGRRWEPHSLTPPVRYGNGPRRPGSLGILIRCCRPPDHPNRLHPFSPARHWAIRLSQQLPPASPFFHKNALRPHST